jgi:hypothetical protein
MMDIANNAALFFTVALLMVTAYFFLGSVPLLILKHDNPVDAKFIQAFYSTYYRIAFFTALGAMVSYALSARPGFATGAAAIAVVAWVLRRKFLPKMALLESQIQVDEAAAIPVFRKIHKTAISINLVQLVGIVGSLGSF